MKKIIVFVLLAFISIYSNAQGKFEPSVKVSFDLGIDDYKNKSFGAEFIGAYRVNEIFKVGIGIIICIAIINRKNSCVICTDNII